MFERFVQANSKLVLWRIFIAEMGFRLGAHLMSLYSPSIILKTFLIEMIASVMTTAAPSSTGILDGETLRTGPWLFTGLIFTVKCIIGGTLDNLSCFEV